MEDAELLLVGARFRPKIRVDFLVSTVKERGEAYFNRKTALFTDVLAQNSPAEGAVAETPRASTGEPNGRGASYTGLRSVVEEAVRHVEGRADRPKHGFATTGSAVDHGGKLQIGDTDDAVRFAHADEIANQRASLSTVGPH